MRPLFCAFLLTCLGGSWAALARQTETPNARYAVTDLGVLRVFPHSDWSQPNAVNDKGQVALNTSMLGSQSPATVAALWDKGKRIRITGLSRRAQRTPRLSLCCPSIIMCRD